MPQIDVLPFPDYQQPQVLTILQKAARNELLTCTLYQQIEHSIPRYTHPDLRCLAATSRKEDWRHYEILLECMAHIQRGAEQQTNYELSTYQTHKLLTPVAHSAADLLNQIERAEQHSIDFQQQICAMTLGYDYKIFDYAYALLNENMQHNEKVNDWLARAA